MIERKKKINTLRGIIAILVLGFVFSLAYAIYLLSTSQSGYDGHIIGNLRFPIASHFEPTGENQYGGIITNINGGNSITSILSWVSFFQGAGFRIFTLTDSAEHPSSSKGFSAAMLMLTLTDNPERQGHMNVLFINHTSSELYWFEPHGSNSMYGDGVRRIINNYFPTYNLQKNNEWCGVQCKQKRHSSYKDKIDGPGGFCASWSMLLVHLKILNPLVRVDRINEHLLSMSGDQLLDLVLRYQSYLDSIKTNSYQCLICISCLFLLLIFAPQITSLMQQRRPIGVSDNLKQMSGYKHKMETKKFGKITGFNDTYS
jgi:hypothetical protein